MKICVCVFAYKRMDHLKKLFESILASDYSNFLYDLHIFYDGAKGDKDQLAVENVRSLSVPFASAQKHINSTNIGLANSIKSGVGKVFGTGADAVIVLEDDLILGSDFFSLMTEMLSFYGNDQNVGSVTGFSYNLFNEYDSYDCYLSKRFMSWGWGTWKDRWQNVDWNTKSSFEVLHRMRIDRSGGDDLLEMYGLQQLNRIDSWAILFAGYHLIHNKYCVYPVKTRVINKGFDHTGTHCSRKNGVVVKDLTICTEAVLNRCYKLPSCFDYTLWNSQLELYSNSKVSIIRKFFRWFIRKVVL